MFALWLLWFNIFSFSNSCVSEVQVFNFFCIIPSPLGSTDFVVVVSYLIDKNHTTMRSVLFEMSYKLDDSGEPICSCHPVQTFFGGPTCKLLTKSAIFQSPQNDGKILVCTGDEASKSALVSLLFLFYVYFFF